MSDDFARLRAEYAQEGLSEGDLSDDPFVIFRAWFEQARVLPEPNAMVVATVSSDGQPSARMVLLKALDERGFSFFTNLQSHKGSELHDNPRCALLFPWHPLQRQVRVEGSAQLLDRDEVAAYFATRPRGAQLGAWASPQSQVVTADEMRRAYDDAAAHQPEQVPPPEHWGGYVVVPERIEFWQGRANRMHDRWRYRRAADGTSWLRERLAP
ncbi:pyridoxamine 5'-phosphate oxidase [Nocardioides sp. JQ2195]|uniref:pyridoxamine 5'-phosphate oxidase n=1 Tax=Nocardioides sp. JQ2195 TaxID=2592334 RepID=UPI00143E3E01|nr:pyridoxamine 5'-phosphate oxidase [Nocardioides sp. JQ2195]QIX28033.1 pyridoxamine 5'-phosphate oxidase [Nocardioides sp. JQ2195]